MTKICRKCQKEKDLSEFGKNKACKDGKDLYCKECNREKCRLFRKNNPEAFKASRKKYCKNNPEKVKKWKKADYERNKEKYLMQNRQYRKDNAEKIKETKRKYYLNNKDKKAVWDQNYRKKNKEKLKEKRKKYRQENKEKRKLYVQKYKKENIEKLKEIQKKDRTRPSFYNTYAHRLTVDEAPRPTGDGLLEVKCMYCRKYFKPRNMDVKHRIEAIEGVIENTGNYLYCSDKCKSSCPVFGQQTYPKNFLPNNKRIDQPELRSLVIERDGETCQICGDTQNLVCHHLESVSRNPIESADLDNCITLCSRCHREKVHKDINCEPAQLRC